MSGGILNDHFVADLVCQGKNFENGQIGPVDAIVTKTWWLTFLDHPILYA